MDIPSFEDLFKFIKVSFWVIGIPFNEKSQPRYYIFLVWLNIMIIMEATCFVNEFSPENFLQLTQLGPCVCVGWLSIAKMYVLGKERRTIFQFVERLSILYEDILRDEKKVSHVKANFIFLKNLTKYFYLLNAILVSVYNFSAIFVIMYCYVKNIDIQYTLPYPIWTPVPMDSFKHWIGLYLHSIINGFVCVLCFTTFDVLYCITTSHVCNQFTILSEEIKELQTTTTHLLTDIIRRHQNIIKLSEDLNHIFELLNLFNVLVGSLEICALGFNLTMGKWHEMPRYFLFLASVVLQILLLSVFGEKLITESSKIAQAVYECNWYEFDQKTKKTLLFLMLRASKPQTITAYKFSVISYQSFSKIMSTSWSYFTILKTCYKPPEYLSNNNDM